MKKHLEVIKNNLYKNVEAKFVIFLCIMLGTSSIVLFFLMGFGNGLTSFNPDPIYLKKKEETRSKSFENFPKPDRGIIVRYEYIPVYLVEDPPEIICNCPIPKEDLYLDWDKIHDLELLAQLIQAEAGNQDLTGMRYVADVVLNRMDSPDWPNTVYDVIHQKNQFSVVASGAFSEARNNISENAYLAAELEWDSRLDSEIVFFNSGAFPLNGQNAWKYMDHWFAY